MWLGIVVDAWLRAGHVRSIAGHLSFASRQLLGLGEIDLWMTCYCKNYGWFTNCCLLDSVRTSYPLWLATIMVKNNYVQGRDPGEEWLSKNQQSIVQPGKNRDTRHQDDQKCWFIVGRFVPQLGDPNSAISLLQGLYIWNRLLDLADIFLEPPHAFVLCDCRCSDLVLGQFASRLWSLVPATQPAYCKGKGRVLTALWLTFWNLDKPSGTFKEDYH